MDRNITVVLDVSGPLQVVNHVWNFTGVTPQPYAAVYQRVYNTLLHPHLLK